MTAPSVDYTAVMPMLIVFGVALLSVLVEAFVPRAQRYLVQVAVTTVGVAAALIFVVSRDAYFGPSAADASLLPPLSLRAAGGRRGSHRRK